MNEWKNVYRQAWVSKIHWYRFTSVLQQMTARWSLCKFVEIELKYYPTKGAFWGLCYIRKAEVKLLSKEFFAAIALLMR